MRSDLLTIPYDANLQATKPNQHLLSRRLPGNGVAIRPVADVGVDSNAADLLREEGIGRPPVYRKQVRALLVQRFRNEPVGSSVHSLVGNVLHPPVQLGIQLLRRPGDRLSGSGAKKTTQKVLANVADPILDLSLRLRPPWAAEPGDESPVAREVQKRRVPADLVPLVASFHNRLHVVVEDLMRS